MLFAYSPSPGEPHFLQPVFFFLHFMLYNPLPIVNRMGANSWLYGYKYWLHVSLPFEQRYKITEY